MRFRPNSLVQYASRRYHLAAGRILDNGNPFCLPIDTAIADAVLTGKPFLSFAHYDYLGLAADPRIAAAANEAIHRFGTGVGASRLVGGERSIHAELEADIASFIGTEDALTLVSGYGTNASLVSHLMASGDLILFDDYAHNSIVAGARSSRALCSPFPHNDLVQLDALLRAKRSSYGRALIIVEGLYSMDGDIPDLPKLIDICRHHDCWLMIDEAHSIGVLGKTGRGITEHYGISAAENVDLIVGTMSKALVNCGAFVCAKREVIRWLRYSLPGFVYSVGLQPHTAAAVRAALAITRKEPQRVARLVDNSQYFLRRAVEHGFDVGSAIGCGVVPVLLPSPGATMASSAALLAQQIYVPPIVQIGVPKDLPRLRFFLSADHTEAQIDRALNALARWRDGWREPAEPASVLTA